MDSTILHLMTEATLLSDTLMRVLVIGLSRDLPLQASDALDIVDKLVARAANAHSAGTSTSNGLLYFGKFLC